MRFVPCFLAIGLFLFHVCFKSSQSFSEMLSAKDSDKDVKICTFIMQLLVLLVCTGTHTCIAPRLDSALSHENYPQYFLMMHSPEYKRTCYACLAFAIKFPPSSSSKKEEAVYLFSRSIFLSTTAITLSV